MEKRKRLGIGSRSQTIKKEKKPQKKNTPNTKKTDKIQEKEKRDI